MNSAFYRDLLGDIKTRVRHAQHRAVLSANAEMILMYWDIGRMIAARQKEEGWGTGVIPRLAADLKNELPEEKGFSERNIGRMIAFHREYPFLPQPVAKVQRTAALLETPQSQEDIILPRAVAKLDTMNECLAQWQWLLTVSWAHHIILMEKLKDLPTRYWYARQALEQGWSRDTLIVQIKNRAHERQGSAITNFANTLPEAHAAIAQGLLKDPYIFDFLTLEEPFHERESEAVNISREDAKARSWNVEELSAIVVDTAFHIHRDLGPGLLESVYQIINNHTETAESLLEINQPSSRLRAFA